MFRTALEIADLHPDAVRLPDDHQAIIGSTRLHYLDWDGSAGKWAFKHDQRPRSEEGMRSFSADRVRLASELSKIRCPTLVVRGALSDILTDDTAEKFARSLPDGRRVRVENSGHNVQGDNPRGLLDAMIAFFRESGIS